MKKKQAILWTVMLAVSTWLFAPAASAADGGEGATVINVGTNPTFPPFEMMDGDKPVGFDLDLIRAAAETQGIQVTIRTMPFSGIVPSLQASSIDAAASGITITKDRLENVRFTQPYYRSGLSVMVRSDSDISGFDDLQGHVVATQKATSSVNYMQANGIPANRIKLYQSIDSAYQALANGSVDAVLFDNPVNVSFKTDHDNVKIVGDLLTGEYYGFAVDRKRPELVDQLNAGLQQLREDGSYEKLFEQYFGGDLSGAVLDSRTPEEVAQ